MRNRGIEVRASSISSMILVLLFVPEERVKKEHLATLVVTTVILSKKSRFDSLGDLHDDYFRNILTNFPAGKQLEIPLGIIAEISPEVMLETFLEKF